MSLGIRASAVKSEAGRAKFIRVTVRAEIF
jgi:hypothetical protein